MLNRTMSRILYRLNLPHKDLKFIAEEDSLIMTYIRIQKVPSVGFIIYNLTLLGMSVVYFVAYRQAYGLALLFIAFTLYSIKFLWTAAVVSAAKKYSVNKYFLNLCEKELSINGLHAKRAYSNSRLKIRREKFRRWCRLPSGLLGSDASEIKGLSWWVRKSIPTKSNSSPDTAAHYLSPETPSRLYQYLP